jgi:hypothetical protein
MLTERHPPRRPGLAAYARLRGLVQPVLSSRRYLGDLSRTDCFRALGIKGKRPRGLADPSNSAAFLFQPSRRSLTMPVVRMSDFVC